MRTSLARAKSARTTRRQSTIAVTLACVSVAITATTVALQDVVELTGVSGNEQERWTAHMIAVPTGSTHFKTDGESKSTSPYTLNRSMAVDMGGKLSYLDKSIDRRSGKPQVINRSYKGERVFVPVKEELIAVSTDKKLLWRDSYTEIRNDEVPQDDLEGSLIAAAQAFLPRDEPKAVSPASSDHSQNVLFAQKANETNELVTLASLPTDPAAEAAKEMNALAPLPESQSTSLVSAYQPPEPVTSSGSVFSAVLRPALKPEDPVRLTVPTKRPAEMPKARIRLAKGDHKWALNPLPRKSWSKAQRECLASGIYFEARGEPVKGQQAVAQVILNRVKNPAYPDSICGVVYQNKRMRNRCQFSFACDGIRDRVNSRKHWKIAKKVADDALHGRVWIRAVGSASHYHADYVWPRWRRSMKRMTKIGRHIFYRTIGGGWS